MALQGRYEEAEPLLEESLRWYQAEAPDRDHPILRARLADLYRATGRGEAAAALELDGSTKG